MESGELDSDIPQWIHRVCMRKYEFDSKKDVIGVGASGCIIRARSREGPRGYFAIKFINMTKLARRTFFISDISIHERVTREAKIHKKFDHPNIVKLFKWGYVPPSLVLKDEVFYIIMEYVEGVTLFDLLIKHTKMSERRAHKYFLQILDATTYMHKQRIIHRDLKLENIMITKDRKKIVLLDFGLSREINGDNFKTMCGSPLYCAPELWRGEPYDGGKVDVWALGIILYSLVTGHFPFFEKDLNNLTYIAQAVSKEKLQIPVELSANLRRLLHDMLAKEPKLRMPMDEIYDRTWTRLPHTMWCTSKSCPNGVHTCLSRNQSWTPLELSGDFSPLSYSESDVSPRSKKTKRRSRGRYGRKGRIPPHIPRLSLNKLALSDGHVAAASSTNPRTSDF